MFSYSKWNSKMIITFFRTFTTWGYLYSQFLQRLWFLGFCLFSKKTWVLAARLGARNFTRALGYAKHPLSVVHAFADARFPRRTLSQMHAFLDMGHLCSTANIRSGLYWVHIHQGAQMFKTIFSSIPRCMRNINQMELSRNIELKKSCKLFWKSNWGFDPVRAIRLSKICIFNQNIATFFWFSIFWNCILISVPYIQGNARKNGIWNLKT